MKDMERMSSEENTLRRDRMEFEKNMALAKHEVKEVNIQYKLNVPNLLK